MIDEDYYSAPAQSLLDEQQHQLEEETSSVDKNESTKKQVNPTANEEDNVVMLKFNNNNKLPTGWEEATDPTSRNIYYYNTTTGYSSWIHPNDEQFAADVTTDVDAAEPFADEQVEEDEYKQTAVRQQLLNDSAN